MFLVSCCHRQLLVRQAHWRQSERSVALNPVGDGMLVIGSTLAVEPLGEVLDADAQPFSA
jgi:hypothetical protein